MKFIAAFLALFTAAATVAAQSIDIGSPAPGTSLIQGQTVTVQVLKPASLSSSTDVAVAIGLVPCGTSTTPALSCAGVDPTTQGLRQVLFHGIFDPTSLSPTTTTQFQNYTVTVPSGFGGAALLVVSHFALVGASFGPVLETVSETVFVQ